MVARVRGLIDSLLHPRRRRSAARLLQDTKPRSVLFVCQGNICRSPFAAALFEQMLPAGASTRVTSGGFIGPGRAPPDHALTTARTYGIDMSGHRSRALTSDTLQDVDLVVVMSGEQARGLRARIAPQTKLVVLGDLDPLPIQRRTIFDPWDSPASAFHDSYQRINRCVRELARIAWPPS